jgi:hypothetical protein
MDLRGTPNERIKKLGWCGTHQTLENLVDGPTHAVDDLGRRDSNDLVSGAPKDAVSLRVGQHLAFVL